MNEQMEGVIKEEKSEQEKKEPFTPHTLMQWFEEHDCLTNHISTQGKTDYVANYKGIKIEWDSNGDGGIDGGKFKVEQVDPNNPIQSFLAFRP
jgi:hypothetical protein